MLFVYTYLIRLLFLVPFTTLNFSLAYIVGYALLLVSADAICSPYFISFFADVNFSSFIYFSISSRFKLLAVIPLLVFEYKLLHASFSNLTALLYPCASPKYTFPLVGLVGTNSTFLFFIDKTFHSVKLKAFPLALLNVTSDCAVEQYFPCQLYVPLGEYFTTEPTFNPSGNSSFSVSSDNSNSYSFNNLLSSFTSFSAFSFASVALFIIPSFPFNALILLGLLKQLLLLPI